MARHVFVREDVDEELLFKHVYVYVFVFVVATLSDIGPKQADACRREMDACMNGKFVSCRFERKRNVNDLFS